MLEALFRARQKELAVAERTIDLRMQWEQFSRIDRLEKALRVARGRLRWPATPSMPAKAN